MTTVDEDQLRPSRSSRAVDALATRMLGLPKGSGYTVARGVRVPMRDGAELVADRGYHVVLQNCRGTFGSGGSFHPFAREVDDGADTVAWLREQPWFTGRFATLGGSYFGYTQWALLVDPPPELATAIVLVGVHDVHGSMQGTGAFSLETWLSWFDSIGRQEEGGLLRGLVRQLKAARRLAPVYDELPLLPAGERHLARGAAAQYFREFVTHPDADDAFWTPIQVADALDRVQVPVLLVGGWQDLFLGQTLEQYERLRSRGTDVALTVGPWVHSEVVTKGARLTTSETLDWLAEHLAGTPSGGRPQPVHLHVTGAGEWRHLPGWPPKSADQVLYLLPDGGLGSVEPDPDAAPSTFPYDPADPTPAVGGRRLTLQAGYRDNTALEQRDDVLTFTGAVLSEPLEVIGVPEVEIAHTSDNPHADLLVRLCEVDAKGRSRNVSDAFTRLDPADRSGVVRLSLDAIAHRFAAGSRIRVQVSGGAHPHYARNLGTDGDQTTSTRLVPSHRTVAHGRGGTSRVVLPVVP